jgi:putative acetyltransferase
MREIPLPVRGVSRHAARVLVRREAPVDRAAVDGVIGVAFAAGGADPVEVRLAGELRASGAWLPHLSLVAVAADETVIGQVMCSRGWIGETGAVALGPVAVRPDQQGRGIGKALVHAALGGADALDEPVAALLGSPRYYGRFGFRPAVEHGIIAPDPNWGEYFQVRTLTAFSPTIRGAFRYAEPFDRV